MPWFDFSPVLAAMNMASNVTLEFSRLAPVSPTFKDGGIVSGSAAYAPFVLDPPGYFVAPRAPKEFLARLDEGDRQRDRILVWTFATASAESQLFTIKQLDHARADRVRDVGLEKTYVCEAQWSYPRQSNLSGVICVLLDQ